MHSKLFSGFYHERNNTNDVRGNARNGMTDGKVIYLYLAFLNFLKIHIFLLHASQ